jgi:hypothetical protein
VHLDLHNKRKERRRRQRGSRRGEEETNAFKRDAERQTIKEPEDCGGRGVEA